LDGSVDGFLIADARFVAERVEGAVHPDAELV
jgi:hypothetical protein